MDKNLTPINEDLIAKYLLGEATVEECSLVDNWKEESPENQQLLDDYAKILSASRLTIDDSLDAQAALDRLNIRLENETKVHRMSWKTLMRIAALFAFVFSSWFIYKNTVANEMDIMAGNQTITRQLPDGSTAILNQHASLSFVGGFFKSTRAVKLSGEAFFEVRPDKRKPFIIDINDVQVTVVGTAFNVKGSGNETTVSVESGIVRVSDPQGSIMLKAGEKVRVTANGLIKSETRGKLYNYYYTNELVCDGTPLEELVQVLNEKFKSNVVIVNPAIAQLPLSTTFKNESLDEILEIVAMTLKIKVEHGKRAIRLK